MIRSASILLVGCGRMGFAMLKGWLDRGLPASRATIVDPGLSRETAQSLRGCPWFPTAEGASRIQAEPPDVVVVAVKPQILDRVLPAYREYSGRSLFLSVVAGKTVAAVEEILGGRTAVVRAMPNTPALVGAGMAALYANAQISDGQKTLARALLEAVGHTAWIENEDLMDAVTAVSGSGPAYIFWLTDCLAKAGVEAGLPKDLATRLAKQTVIGSGALMADTEEDVETLRQNVASPGGTTAAALEVLMADDGLGRMMRKTVEAATRRSRELAG